MQFFWVFSFGADAGEYSASGLFSVRGRCWRIIACGLIFCLGPMLTNKISYVYFLFWVDASDFMRVCAVWGPCRWTALVKQQLQNNSCKQTWQTNKRNSGETTDSLGMTNQTFGQNCVASFEVLDQAMQWTVLLVRRSTVHSCTTHLSLSIQPAIYTRNRNTLQITKLFDINKQRSVYCFGNAPWALSQGAPWEIGPCVFFIRHLVNTNPVGL